MSSEQQSDTLPDQRAWAIEVAQRNGWTLERIGDFEDVSTGKHGPRKLVTRLLSDIESLPPERRPQWVLMPRIDRIGRGSIMENQYVAHRLKQLGVKVWLRYPEGELKLDSALEELMVAIHSAVARIENEVRAEKARAVVARKRKAGQYLGYTPYGGVVVEGGKLIAYEPEAVWVRRMFELRVSGWGWTRLAKFMRANAPGKRLSGGGQRTMLWDRGTIAWMLKNAVLRGTIIPEELFDAAQAVRYSTTFTRDPKHHFPLRGVLRCTCGKRLYAAVASKARAESRYYTCRDLSHERVPIHHAATLERQFVDLLVQLAQRPEMRDVPFSPVGEMEERLAAAKEELADIERRKRLAWDIAEAGGISATELRDRILHISADQQRLAAEVRQVEAAIADARNIEQSRRTVQDAMESIADVWERAAPEEQREMAKAVADYVGGLYVAPTSGRDTKTTRLLVGR